MTAEAARSDHRDRPLAALMRVFGEVRPGEALPVLLLGANCCLALIAYYVLSIEIYLATYCVGRFQMSFWGWGPTELRILLALGALTLMVKPVVTLFGLQMMLFDVGGIAGTIGLIGTAIISAVGNTRRLYAAEPLPQTLVSRRRDAEARSSNADTQSSILLCGLRK